MTTAFSPKDEGFRHRCRGSFGRQTFMSTLGVEMAEIEPGLCVLAMPVRADLCQQNGFVHAGATTALADTAAGYAAYSLMPAEADVLTVEFKMNLLNPARGDRLVARAQVLKPGRTLVVVRSDVFGVTEGEEKLVATMLATMMAL